MRNFKKIRIYVPNSGQVGFFDIYDCHMNLSDDTRRTDGRYKLQEMLKKIGVSDNNDGTNLITIFFEKGQLKYANNDSCYPQILKNTCFLEEGKLKEKDKLKHPENEKKYINIDPCNF